MRTKICTLLCIFWFNTGLLAYYGEKLLKIQPKIANKVNDKFAPFTKTKFTGYLGNRIDININKRLLNIDQSVLLSGFKKRPGAQEWIGEHLGKFLNSASLSYYYSKNEKLKKLTDNMVKEFIPCQLPNGYLGTYLPEEYWTSWDVWAHKYDIIGLLSYYSITGYEPALATAIKAADLVCKTFGNGPGQLNILQSGHHIGMASGSILEPMIDLYRYTGDSKYLDFAKYILQAWESEGGPGFVANLSSYGEVTKVGNAKAYEMMSCMVGIVKYYKLTGDEKYLQIINTAWTDIVLNRLYITGTASSFEHFQVDNYLPAENDSRMGEGCVTTTWIQLNYALLTLTADAKYAHEIEKAVYNHLLAAENPITGCVSYYTALNGVRPHECNQGYSCCLSSIPRGVSLIPELIWGKQNDNIVIYMYEAGAFTDSITSKEGQKIAVSAECITRFPNESKLTYVINPSAQVTLDVAFRVPPWAKNFTATIGTQTFAGTPGKLLVISQKWKKDDKVIINFEMPLQIVPGGPTYPDKVALKRGPQVMSIDAKFADIPQNYSLDPNNIILTDQSSKLPAGWVGVQLYSVNATTSGKTYNLYITPFADAGQEKEPNFVWLNIFNFTFKK